MNPLSVFHKEGMTTEDKSFDIIFYLAQDCPGGRIRSVFLNGSWIEVGAQWIHGQNNEVWKLAHKYDLLSTVTSSEGEGKKLIN
jgi:monoamine oxidase